MNRRSILALLAAGLAGAALPAAAASAAALSPEDQALVDRAAAYIQALHTVRGRFTQTTSNGASSSGEFYMQRPGKARFQYDPPTDLVVVSDGYNVKINDRRLQTFDQYPLGSTPLILLLAKDVRLDRGVAITDVQQSADGFSITARDARHKTEGRITLRFGGDPMALRGWTVIDAQGVQTRVALGALTPVGALDPGLFVMRNPRDRGDR